METTAEPRPEVVPKDRLIEPPEQRTSGMHRAQAYVAEDRWIGLVRGEPGEWSGWHHHGNTDTYFYVLAGQVEIEYGAVPTTLAVGHGDYVHLPRQLVHRERTGPGEPAELVLVRIGQGPAVVNVDGPGG
jgi:uncharacterized RmlC-like cupin family protein